MLVTYVATLKTYLLSSFTAYADNNGTEAETIEGAGNGAGTDLSGLGSGNGVRIDGAFKPINAPDAINQNYTSDTVNAFIQFIAGSLIEITAGISIFILVIAGYVFVTAGGDQGRVDKAKEIVKYTIFGMLLVILSFVIVKTIISLLLEVDTF